MSLFKNILTSLCKNVLCLSLSLGFAFNGPYAVADDQVPDSDSATNLGLPADSALNVTTDRADFFHLFNQELPEKEQNVDFKRSFVSFVNYGDDPADVSVRNVLNFDDPKSQAVMLEFSEPIKALTFTDPLNKTPFLWYFANEGELIIKATYIDGKLFFVTRSQAEGDRLKVIDLERFSRTLGKARVPVFELPHSGLDLIQIHKGQIGVSGEVLHPEVLKQYLHAQETVFNVSANLLNPKTYQAAAALVEDFDAYLKRSQEIMAKNSGYMDLEIDKDLLGSMKAYLGNAVESVEQKNAQNNTDENYAPSEAEKELEALTKSVAEKKVAMRGIQARIEMLKNIISRPVYLGSRYYVAALGTLAKEGRLGPSALEKFRQAKKRGSLMRKLTSPWSLTLATFTLAAIFPQNAHAIVEGAGDLGQDALHWLKDFTVMNWEALKASTASIRDPKGVFYDKLFAPGQRHKLGWIAFGFFSSLATIAGLSHFGVVKGKIKKEYKHYVLEMERTGQKPLEFKEFLIRRQQQKEKEYLKSLEDSQTGHHEEEKVWTDLENKEVSELLHTLRAKDSKIIEKIREKLSKEKKEKQIVTFADAVKHSKYSMAAFTDSQNSLMKGYNALFYWRSYLRFLDMDWMSFRYPNAVKVMMSRDNDIVLPTEFNGGLMSRFSGKPKGSELELEQLKLWESKIVEVEKAIEAVALQKSTLELLKFIDDAEELEKFVSDNGVKRISDVSLERLSPEAREFFVNYYDLLSTEMMVEFLGELVEKQKGTLSKRVYNMSPADLKAATLEAIDSLDLKPTDADRILEKVTGRVDLHGTVMQAIESKGGTWIKNFRWKAAKRLDPEISRQANRIHTVRTLAKNTKAVVRAVRNAIAEIIVDKPLEFAQMIVFTAGVQTGINALFGDQMFGSDSIFYLSRYAFLYSFVWGTFFSILGSSAMKLQLDQKNEANFDHIPQGEDAKRGFWSWYFKHLIPGKNNPNKFMPLHKHIVGKLVIPNIPAYLTLTIPVHLIFLGRVELDTLTMGYLFTFFMGTSTIDAYADQAYEFSANHPLKDIPEKYRNHPDVLKYVAAKQQVLRFKVNVFTKTLQNFIGFYTSTLSTLTAAGHYANSFTRHFFGGYTPTELVLNPLRVVRNVAKGIPVLEQVAAIPSMSCEALLAKTYKAGQRLVPLK